jgi:anti-sigma regulatory factor (Ser/Thr protein kinase)
MAASSASARTLRFEHAPILRRGFARARGYNLHGDSAEPIYEELSYPRGPVREIAFTEGDLSDLRREVYEWAIGEQMVVERVQDLMLAAHEIAANSVRHGGGVGILRMWREGETLLCEVQDAGHIREPLIGLFPPDSTASSGRGLWIANVVCDLVQIRSSMRGTQIRLHKRMHAV